MSSYIYYKIPYEGKIYKIKELIKDRNWDLEMKIPKEGILLVKIPTEIDDEILFSQNSTIDEETQTKFGEFQSIKESEYEKEVNIELNDIKDEKENNLMQNKKNKNMEYKRQMSEILLNEDRINQKNNLIKNITFPKINLKEFNKEIEKKYKDPFDYFFSQNYLILCFILAVIFLVIFNF